MTTSYPLNDLSFMWLALKMKKATRRCTSSRTITEGPRMNPSAYYYFYNSPVNLNSRDRHLHSVYGVVLCSRRYICICANMSWNNGCLQFVFLEETEPAIYFASHCLKGNCILCGDDFIFIIPLYVSLHL